MGLIKAMYEETIDEKTVVFSIDDKRKNHSATYTEQVEGQRGNALTVTEHNGRMTFLFDGFESPAKYTKLVAGMVAKINELKAE